MSPELQRALRPKITPQAAARMHAAHLTGIAVTTSTLAITWWGTFWDTWAAVLFPEGAQP